MAFISPGFKPVSRQTLSKSLLESTYTKTLAAVTLKLQEQKAVTLGCDGSSDGCQDPITHIVAVTKGCPPFLLREVSHYTEDHSSANILITLDEDVKYLNEVCYENQQEDKKKTKRERRKEEGREVIYYLFMI